MTSQEPFIFILDLDGTIIGDCAYQVIVQNIEDVAKANKIKINSKEMLIDCYNESSSLIRPYFKYFINNMKTHYTSQFFVYTASEKSWANKEIAMIEKTHNFKFNRPLFTRDDCIVDSFGNYKKSVKKILPRIKKANKNIQINNDNILVIDNNRVFIDFSNNMIECPTYNYVHFCDIWEKIDEDHMRNASISHMIGNLIMTNKMCKYSNCKNTDAKKKELKHKWMYKKYKKLNKSNKPFERDVFWKRLANGIVDKNMKSFNKNNVSLLRKLSCRDKVVGV
jgi:hypothetical protein